MAESNKKLKKLAELILLKDRITSYNVCYTKLLRELTAKDSELFIQEYVPYIHDIRVFVINNEIVGAMERIPKNNWKANYSLGAEIKKIELSKDVERMVLNAAKKVNADIVGVDVLVSKDKNYILERNNFV